MWRYWGKRKTDWFSSYYTPVCTHRRRNRKDRSYQRQVAAGKNEKQKGREIFKLFNHPPQLVTSKLNDYSLDKWMNISFNSHNISVGITISTYRGERRLDNFSKMIPNGVKCYLPAVVKNAGSWLLAHFFCWFQKVSCNKKTKKWLPGGGGPGWKKVKGWATDHECMTHRHRQQGGDGQRQGVWGEVGKVGVGGLGNGDICNSVNNKNKEKNDCLGSLTKAHSVSCFMLSFPKHHVGGTFQTDFLIVVASCFFCP